MHQWFVKVYYYCIFAKIYIFQIDEEFIINSRRDFFVGCKENKAKAIDNTKIDSEIVVKPKQEENFKVKLKGVFNRDDKFALFYVENESEKYNAEKLVTTKFLGSNETQEINFEFPADVYPLSFRLDFGSNKEQLAVKIYECTLSYKGESYIIDGKNLRNYFNFNDGIKMQSDSVTFKLKTFKFKDKDRYDPYMNGNKNLTEVLDFEL